MFKTYYINHLSIPSLYITEICIEKIQWMPRTIHFIDTFALGYSKDNNINDELLNKPLLCNDVIHTFV